MPEISSVLHPYREPYATHRLDVGDGHVLYVEESGNPEGLPVLMVHGGPGAGSQPEHRGYFDPEVWRIVLFDQRGCGKSWAKDALAANTTQHLVGDMEQIRGHLGVAKWHLVAGWSWGSTLTLAYAEAHPEQVGNVVVSSVFLADAAALRWMVEGVKEFYPQDYKALLRAAGVTEPEELVAGLLKVVTGANKAKALAAGALWVVAEGLTMQPEPDRAAIEESVKAEPEAVLRSTQLMMHYMAQKCFLAEEQLVNEAHKLAGIRVQVSHGDEDMCCLPENAEKLARAVPGAVYKIVPECGHRSTDAMKAVRVKQIEAAAKYK